MSAYSTAVLARTPSLYWDLAANGATDLSGNGRNGSGSGGITIGGFSGSPVAADTLSTDFDGSDDYITSTYKPFSNATTRTFIGFANRDGTGRDALFGSDTFPFALCELGVGEAPNSDDIEFSPDWGTTDAIWTHGWPGSTQWVFWALIFNESTDTAEFFINGVSLGTKTNTGTYTAGKNLRVGAWDTGVGIPFDGKMAHFAVFESALTPTQIANLYTAASTPAAAPNRALMGVGT